MKFGIVGVNVGPYATAAGAKALAMSAESHGFESLWTFEHVVAPIGYTSTYPYASGGKAPRLMEAHMPDPLIWLSFAAAVTSTIKLGTGILILPQRNPVVLAKEVASLDVLSEGRVRLGIGVGWLREEFEAIGVPFERRGARTDDAIAAMRALWAGEDASHAGEFFSFSHVNSLPSPPGGTVHITVGGHSEAAAKRAGRLGDGFFPALDAASIEELGLVGAIGRAVELVQLARQTAQDAGRDPATIEMSLNTGMAPPAEVVEQLAAGGFDRIVVFAPRADEATVDGELAALAEQCGLR